MRDRFFNHKKYLIANLQFLYGLNTPIETTFLLSLCGRSKLVFL